MPLSASFVGRERAGPLFCVLESHSNSWIAACLPCVPGSLIGQEGSQGSAQGPALRYNLLWRKGTHRTRPTKGEARGWGVETRPSFQGRHTGHA